MLLDKKSKWYSLIEIIIYMFFVGFVLFVSMEVFLNYLNTHQNIQSINNFQSSYSNFVHNIYTQVYQWYEYVWEDEWIIFSGDDMYFGYNCKDTWILKTNLTWAQNDINWNTWYLYEDFECKNLDIVENSQYTWYNLQTSINFLERQKDFTHFIKK